MRKETQGWFVLLILHKKGHWGLPKGHADPGESHQETARRELREETGLDIEQWLDIPPLKEFYIVLKEPKEVTYYCAIIKGDIALMEEEVIDFQWLPVEQAAERATFTATKELLKQVAKISFHSPSH